MKVKFTEGPAAVLIDGVGRVERGHTAEVSKETGERLLEQGWTRVGAASPKRKASPKKTADSADAGSQTPEPGPTKESD